MLTAFLDKKKSIKNPKKYISDIKPDNISDNISDMINNQVELASTIQLETIDYHTLIHDLKVWLTELGFTTEKREKNGFILLLVTKI